MSLDQRMKLLEAEVESVNKDLKGILVELRQFILQQNSPFSPTQSKNYRETDRDPE